MRDIDEARTYALPIYCRSLTPRTARGRVEEAEVNGPVCIGGVTVNPGDLVIADGSGVVFIPAARAAEVIARLLGLNEEDCAVKKGALWWLRHRERAGASQTVVVTVQTPELI